MANRRIQGIPITSRPDGGFRPLSRMDNITRSGSGDYSMHTFQAVQPRLSGQERSNTPAKGPMLNPQFQYEYDPRFDYETPVGQIIGGGGPQQLSPTPTQASSWRIQSQSETSYNQSIAGSGSRATSVGEVVIPACSMGNVADVGPGLTNQGLFQNGHHLNDNFVSPTVQSNLNKRQGEDSGNDENQTSEENHKVGSDEDEEENEPSIIFENHGNHLVADSILDDVTGPLPTHLAETHRRFQIKFHVWRKIVITNSKGKSKQKIKKRGQGNKSAKPTYQWKKYRPTCDVKKILRLSSFAWPIFRRKLLECCDTAKKGISKDLLAADRRGSLIIMGWINGSENHKKNDEAVLNDSITYKLFMDVARRSPANAKMGFKIIHPNPKEHGGTSSEEEEDDRSVLDKEDETQEESEEEDPVDAKLQILMAKFSKSFKAGENVAVFPNPKKSGDIMVLTTRRLRQWAGDWADGKRGVDEVNPPLNRGWRFVPVADYEKERLRMIQMDDGTGDGSVSHSNTTLGGTNVSTSPGISINLFGAGPMPFGHQNFMSPMAPGSNTSIGPHNPTGPFSIGPGPLADSQPANSSVPTEIRSLSPATRPYPDFEEFLIFAKIRPQMTHVREALEKEGINEFERLLDREIYTVECLRSFGIPFAQAADIWKAVPRFNDWFKNL
ncbi:hypothetical protein DFH28DRAFT_933796 [Melampsora americana]|nr:hypothetical protein DFH28DRAFT_933796 [Melampsora americana]